MSTDYRTRLSQRLPAAAIDDGDPDKLLFTKSGLLVGIGFDRIEIGGRGPYVELSDAQIVPEAIHQVRIGAHYDEFRTNDVDNVKVYRQKHPVDYADYRRGKWYISPFELQDEQGAALIDPLPRKKTAT